MAVSIRRAKAACQDYDMFNIMQRYGRGRYRLYGCDEMEYISSCYTSDMSGILRLLNVTWKETDGDRLF